MNVSQFRIGHIGEIGNISGNISSPDLPILPIEATIAFAFFFAVTCSGACYACSFLIEHAIVTVLTPVAVDVMGVVNETPQRRDHPSLMITVINMENQRERVLGV